MAVNPSDARRRASSTTRVLLVLSLLGGIVFLVMIGAIVWLVAEGDRAEVSEGSFLSVTLSGMISDAPAAGGFVLDPADVPPVPTQISRAIREAAADERIDGVYLRIEGTGGWGVLEELRTSLVDFRASGKPCVVYAEAYDMRAYYLASACDRVVLPPAGVTLVSGLSSSITYYAGTFEKLGVDPEFEHVGDFKSAVEPYERTGPSEPASEAMNLLLDGIWTRVVKEIAEGRGRSVEEIQALIDDPPMSPDDALARGLVDAIAYRDAVEWNLPEAAAADWAAKLQQPVPEDEESREKLKERFTPVKEYVKDIANKDRSKSAFVAVIHADGAIVSGDGEGGLFAEQVLADGPFAKWMKQVREDEDVKAVVLRVNSPGGSGLASDMMWREIQRTKAAGKPVVVSMANYAASGGYYIAAPADWIVAQPLTVTGSIGVFGGKLTFGGTLEKIGMTEHDYSRGRVSDLFSLTKPFSEEGRVVFKSYLEDFYALFLQRVAEGREKTTDEVHLVAQGRVWTGEQALERGLVDELGGLNVAVAKAAQLAEIEDYGIVRLPAQKTFFELLAEDLAETSAPTVEVKVDLPVPQEMQAATEEALLLQKILADNGVAAYLPGDLDIR